MSDDSILDEMDLPLANPNEELETVSKIHLLPLFDASKFEIRSEDLRDKGIDFHFEIKKTNKHTNFRFAVQLKATDSKKLNSDGSVSLQIRTSNINYLLNHAMPAFYVLYFKETKTFYYENLNDFVRSISETKPDWDKQACHSLRFIKILDANAIDAIYQDTIKKGVFNRKLNEKLIQQSASFHIKDKVLVDPNFNVSGDGEIRNIIEKVGFTLINEGKWKEIIQVHKSGSGNIASTALYNLILGIANYYNGNLIDALSFFKTASKLKTELSKELIDHLAYFHASVKSALGLISVNEYQKNMNELEAADNVGLYIKLEKAKNDYYNSLENGSNDHFVKMISEIENIINDPKADNAIKFNARCELILLKGSKNNWDNVKATALLNAIEISSGPNLQMRAEVANNFINSNAAWYKDVADLKAEAHEAKNYFYFSNAVINEVKIIYEMLVFKDSVFIETKILGQPVPPMPDLGPVFYDLLQKLEAALNFYRHVSHIENQVVALSLKYELQHYLNDLGAAKTTLKEAEDLVDNYELTEKNARLECLKNDGTTHQRFKAWVEGIFEEQERKKKEFQLMVEDMKRMDEEERKVTVPTLQYYTIDLFPIGHFKFPKTAKEKVYQILNIKRLDAKQNFDNLIDKIVPIANVYYDEIIQEGPLNGKLADRGIESWRNIYRIRKEFYENGFRRNESIQTW